MMLRRLMGSTVEIVRHGEVGRDEMNDPVTGEVLRTKTRARLEQTGSREDDSDAYVVDRWRAYLPAGTDVRPGDQLVEGGRIFEVDGTPATESIRGFRAVDHVFALLKYVGAVTP